MPTEKHLPRSIDAWLKQLDEVRLPIASAQHERVRKAVLDSRRSLREIAELMQDSPAIALTLLREANRKGNSLSEPAESLEQALALAEKLIGAPEAPITVLPDAVALVIR